MADKMMKNTLVSSSSYFIVASMVSAGYLIKKLNSGIHKRVINTRTWQWPRNTGGLKANDFAMHFACYFTDLHQTWDYG